MGYGLKSVGGPGLKYPMESFDLDIMMPPDIASIDSDINKLSAMTPSPFPGAGGWGNQIDNHNQGYNLGGGFQNEFSNGKIGNHYSNPSNYGQYNQYEGDNQSLYDSKYSPSHTGSYNRELTSQQHMMYNAKQSSTKYYD